jgi:hypothetical protein
MNTTQVRDWDGGQGIEVKDRSPIPAELVGFKATTGPGSRTATISTAATSPPGEQIAEYLLAGCRDSPCLLRVQIIHSGICLVGGLRGQSSRRAIRCRVRLFPGLV